VCAARLQVKNAAVRLDFLGTRPMQLPPQAPWSGELSGFLPWQVSAEAVRRWGGCSGAGRRRAAAMLCAQCGGRGALACVEWVWMEWVAACCSGLGDMLGQFR
jgi:hypothetical protein